MVYNRLCFIIFNLYFFRNNKENEFDMQKNIIEKQTELLNNLKVTEESYQMLIDEKDALEQRNKDLEKINTDLMENIKSNKVLQSELNVKETKIKDMHKNYDDVSILQKTFKINRIFRRYYNIILLNYYLQSKTHLKKK